VVRGEEGQERWCIGIMLREDLAKDVVEVQRMSSISEYEDAFR